MSRIDELLAAIAPDRRAALDGRLRAPFAVGQARTWLAGEGVDAAWALAKWCRDQIAQLPRYGWTDARHTNIVTAFRLVVERWPRDADLPAVWIELVAAVPSYKPAVGRGLVDVMPSSPQVLAAIRRGLATQSIPHRRLLATRLRSSGTLDAELAVTWFADPTLRPIAEEYFTPGLEDHEDLLREQLAQAKQGERESLVRLLRRLDPKLSLTGTHDTSTDGELQARLREKPSDQITAEVWADSLIDRQDPRGELIALELAILRSDPERALELSRSQAAHVATHRKALWNKPGGFPFREKYRGRVAIAFHSDWNHVMRGKSDRVVERVQSFIESVTDVRAPRRVFVGQRHFPIEQTSRLEEPSELTIELAQALGADAAVFADRHGAFVKRDAVAEPIFDRERFVAICTREPQLTLDYDFKLTWPDTGVLLPHQEGEHYAGGDPLAHSLRIFLRGRDIQLRLTFPFEDEGDEGFHQVYDAIRETLGNVFTPSRWVFLKPSADGKKMVAKRFRFVLN